MSKQMAGKEQTLSVKLQDGSEDTEVDREVTIHIGPHRDNVCIGVEGLSVCGMEDVFNAIVYFEFYEGKPRLLVWADINQEDPTHVIDLSGAAIELRK